MTALSQPSPTTSIHAVTGAFSYTGRYIAQQLRAQGTSVRGLVRRPPASDADGVECAELQFVDKNRLAAALHGVEVLHNTYWIRCPLAGMTFDRAVENTHILAEAAAAAGVRRIVHLSVSNAALDSPFGYFRGKAAAEVAIRSTGVPVSVIRPTLVFGREDVLVNNIAWLIRTFRVFPAPGGGDYRVQPVFVRDVADVAVRESSQVANRIIDAAGPEVLAFTELVRAIARAVRVRAMIQRAPVSVARLAGRMLCLVLGDVVITDEELGALMAETLVSSQRPAGATRFTQWLGSCGDSLGTVYTSEVNRHWS